MVLTRRNFLIKSAIAWFALPSCGTTPHSGRTRFILPESMTQENKMGEEYYKKVLGESKLSNNRTYVDMVKRVGNRISKATGQKYKWEFNVIESDQINAWALPGGKIAFYTGIFKMFKNEAELAAVMGHEIAHVTLRHGGERMSQQVVQKLGGSVIAGLAANEQQQQIFLGAYAGVTTVGVMLPFSRAHEFEADNVGTRYMAQAGYEPNAAVDFWKRMKEASKGSKPPELLSTHPADSKRIKELKKFMSKAKKIYGKSSQKHGMGQQIS